LVESKPISIGNVAYVLGMSSKKLHRWYQEVLSGFDQANRTGELDKYNLSIREQGESKEIMVPIFEESNLGEYMAVDEKSLDGKLYTILSNRETGKIALMAETIKTKYLVKIASGFNINKRMKVRSLSRDMATHYQWFGRQAFMNAYHVADKYHVLKHIMEQVQASRIYFRQLELSKRREANKNKKKYQEVTYENGDSTLQLLARSRGLLFRFPSQWTEQQKKRAEILFREFPQIKKIYYEVLRLRRWYKPPSGETTYQKTRVKKKMEIQQIIKEFFNSRIDELMNIAQMLKNNIASILHYFFRKESNAIAEAINRNLQHFINVNYGTRNIKFFLFRVKIHFT